MFIHLASICLEHPATWNCLSNPRSKVIKLRSFHVTWTACDWPYARGGDGTRWHMVSGLLGITESGRRFSKIIIVQVMQILLQKNPEHSQEEFKQRFLQGLPSTFKCGTRSFGWSSQNSLAKPEIQNMVTLCYASLRSNLYKELLYVLHTGSAFSDQSPTEAHNWSQVTPGLTESIPSLITTQRSKQ